MARTPLIYPPWLVLSLPAPATKWLNMAIMARPRSAAHPPLFHPALKTVGPIRKNLGIRTFFNMLGPMVNPAFPATQLVGVYSLEMARIYNYLLQQTDGRFTIIYSLDGYDEISLTNDTKVITNE